MGCRDFKGQLIIDSFMCQGKMTKNVLERYQKLLEEKPEDDNILNMINNYEDALLHPDADDVEAIKSLVKRTFNNTL